MMGKDNDNNQNKETMDYYRRFPNKSTFLKNDYYQLKQGDGFTSPPSSMPAYELKMLREYMHGVNLKQLGESLPLQKKHLLLIRFLKKKRNQRIEVSARTAEGVMYILGRVSVVGRDFVALTTLTERYWIPYSSIESANVPYGVPDMPNNHQQVVYDDALRKKLLTEFSKTVVTQEILKRQFYEESLGAHLQSWKGTKVIVITKDKEYKGKLKEIKSASIALKSFKRTDEISLQDIELIRRKSSVQFFSNFSYWFKELIIRFLKRQPQ